MQYQCVCAETQLPVESANDIGAKDAVDVERRGKVSDFNSDVRYQRGANLQAVNLYHHNVLGSANAHALFDATGWSCAQSQGFDHVRVEGSSG